MKSKIITIYTILFFFSVLSISPVFGETIYVDDDGTADYVKIQDAVNAASEGDTVYVFSGTYYESWAPRGLPNAGKNVVIDETINLVGEDKNNTIIDGETCGDIIGINANYVNISGFTLTNTENAAIDLNASHCTISNIIFLDNTEGIYVSYKAWSNNNSIYDNVFRNDSWSIWIFRGTDFDIKDNIFENFGAGVKIEYYSNSNTIQGNTFINYWEENPGLSYDKAIDIEGNTDNIIIEQNEIDNAYYGIFINALTTQIKNNNIVNCKEGISILTPNGMITGNTISNCQYGLRILKENEETYTLDNTFIGNDNDIGYHPVVEVNVDDIPLTPGFELIIVICAIAIIMFCKRKKL